jgi:hypothetical protein
MKQRRAITFCDGESENGTLIELECGNRLGHALSKLKREREKEGEREREKETDEILTRGDPNILPELMYAMRRSKFAFLFVLSCVHAAEAAVLLDGECMPGRHLSHLISDLRE